MRGFFARSFRRPINYRSRFTFRISLTRGIITAAMKRFASPSRRALLDSPTPALLILLLAFALRVFHLGANAIWWDESLSLYRATRDLPTILANTIQIQTILTTDLQPPLYFLILHFLVPAFGISEFALRFLSVVANVGSVALLYALGCRWFSRTIGLIAAFLGAMSPFWVWYSQEARPYALVLFWSLLAMYALANALERRETQPNSEGSVRALQRPRSTSSKWFFVYVLAAIAALYTNYYAVFLFPFHVFYIFLQTCSLKKTFLPVLPAVSAIFLLPIIQRGAAGNVNSGPSFVPLDIILRDLVHSFSVGITAEPSQLFWLDVAMLALFFIGIVLPISNLQLPTSNSSITSYPLRFMLLAFLLLPTLIIFLASYLRPLYQNSRYLIAWSPAWYLGIGLGINFLSRLSRYFAPIAFLVFLIGALISLNNLYFNPRYAKDDHRAWAESLRERARAGDYLILDSPHTEELFNYYARGIVPYATLPFLADSGAMGYDADRVAIHDALALNRRVWFLSMHVPFDDPEARIEKLLSQEGVLLDREQFRGSSTSISLSLFTQSLPTATLDQISNRTNFLFDSHLRLLGFDLPKEIKPGTRGVVKLFWQLDEPAGEDYGVSLRLLDESGARLGQRDAVPLGNASGSSSWTVGKIVMDARDLPLAVETRPGIYRVQIQVYHSATGNGIGDAIILGDVMVR